jgi:hypothetical protein
MIEIMTLTIRVTWVKKLFSNSRDFTRNLALRDEGVVEVRLAMATPAGS